MYIEKYLIFRTNHEDHKVQEGSSLPADMVQKVSGDVVFKEEQQLVNKKKLNKILFDSNKNCLIEKYS